MSQRTRGQTDSRGASASRTQRNLFEKPEAEGIQVFLDKVESKAEKARTAFEKRWNFSLVDDKPLEGHIQWESVKETKSSGGSRKRGAGERPPSKRASTSRGGTIGKHFKLKKQLTRKKSLDKMIGQLETYSKEIRGAKTKRRRSSGSSSTKRNCGSYFLRPLPQKNYSQFTFTI